MTHEVLRETCVASRFVERNDATSRDAEARSVSVQEGEHDADVVRPLVEPPELRTRERGPDRVGHFRC